MNPIRYDQLLVSSLNNEQKKLESETFKYQSIFLSSIVPDETNARFLPAVLIEDEDALLFVKRKISKSELIKMYNATDQVILGKSCIINCLKYNSSEWKKANKTIESIVELGENISVSELIQAPTIYPVDDGKYQLLTGHRRFFALVYANGYGSAAQFKLYESKPLLTKVKQFQENASREDLPQYGKLSAFLSAVQEIDSLNNARLRVGLKRLTVKEKAATLGISMGAYDNYNVLTRYPCVAKLYLAGLSLPFVKVKKLILSIETNYKETNGKNVLNITDRNAISEEIENQLLNNRPKTKPAKLKFRVKALTSPKAVQTLLSENILKLDTGIKWDNVDWDSAEQVSKVLNSVVDYIEKQSQ